MEPIVVTYGAYIVISVFLTVWVARTLHKNGRVFLVEVFGGDEALADSVNHLLVVGFYLLNLGWIISTLRTYGEIETLRGLVELLCDKIGFVLVVLGMVHFLNIYVFNRMRRRGMERRPEPPPVLPGMMPPLPGGVR